MMEQLKHMGFGTQTIHAGAQKNTFGALQTPIYQSSTFAFENAAQGGVKGSESPADADSALVEVD